MVCKSREAPLLVVWTIAILRSAYRLNVSGDSQSLAARLTRPGWRWRPKPPVGDDPILWREMNLARGGLLANLIGLLIGLAFLGVLGYVTYFFARPALIEVWRHGYSSGITSAERPEWNLMIRFFMPDYGVNPPADIARIELNLFLRHVTTTLIFVVTLCAVGMASEGIVGERARETWDSLIATPLTARDILRSKMLAALWRMRVLLAILLGLWTIGLIAGAIHPVGFVLSVLVAGRIGLVHVGFWDLHLGRSERQGRDDRPHDGTRLLPDRLGSSAIPAAGPIEFGRPGRRLASFRRVCVARVIPRRPQRRRNTRCTPSSNG